MICLRKCSILDITQEYFDMFNNVFGEWIVNGNCPAEVYLGYESDAMVGFFSGYTQSPVSWFIQRAGFLKSEQGRLRNLSRVREGLSELHKEWPFVYTVVSAGDNDVLRFALSADFMITGVSIDTEKGFWVELLHKREGLPNG